MMTKLKIVNIVFSFSLLACTSKNSESSNNNETVSKDSISIDTTIKSSQKKTFIIPDTIKRVEVDDYPVSNEMLAAISNNSSSDKTKSGQCYSYSYDKVWYTNDTLKQTLVFELYTDYHRKVIYHFYNNDIPTEIITRMELHAENGELATEKQKQKDFNGFIKQSNKINSSYFTTKKGLQLGDKKEKAITIYGQPEIQSTTNGIEQLEWELLGDLIYDGKRDLKGKPLAKNSFGQQVILYFRNGKLIAQVIHNYIP